MLPCYIYYRHYCKYCKYSYSYYVIILTSIISLLLLLRALRHPRVSWRRTPSPAVPGFRQECYEHWIVDQTLNPIQYHLSLPLSLSLPLPHMGSSRTFHVARSTALFSTVYKYHFTIVQDLKSSVFFDSMLCGSGFRYWDGGFRQSGPGKRSPTAHGAERLATCTPILPAPQIFAYNGSKRSKLQGSFVGLSEAHPSTLQLPTLPPKSCLSELFSVESWTSLAESGNHNKL